MTVEVEAEGAVVDVTLRLRVPRDFPLSLPRLYLSQEDQARYGPLPHVNGDGLICTFDEAAVHVNAENPGAIAVECVSRAARLLEAGLNEADPAAFEDEFLAYWGLTYGARDRIESGWLSLIDNAPSASLCHVTLSQALGPYSRVLHEGGAQWDQLRSVLDAAGNRYAEHEAFYAGELTLNVPPLALTNGDVIRIMAEAGVAERFERYVKRARSPVVTFSRWIKGDHVLLGWRHDPPRTQRKGFRKGTIKPYDALRTFERGRHVVRLAPDRFTPDRLHRRSSGGPLPAKRPALFVAGLGSIGSLLVDRLSMALSPSLGLLDPDVLTSENVGRHLLGLSYVGWGKAAAVQDHLLKRNPLLPVSTVEGLRIGEALQDDPNVFTGFDRLFIAIGDTATEHWVGNELSAGRVAIPTFFLWVEPHLAGGHCVYLRPGGVRLADLFERDLYRWNVIAPSEYRTRVFTRREAGCQTSFVPYPAAHVARFVAAVLPHVIDAVLDDDVPSFRLTWTGDLAALDQLGITVSRRARAARRFHLQNEVLDA